MKFIVYSLVLIFEDELRRHIYYQTYLQAVFSPGDGKHTPQLDPSQRKSKSRDTSMKNCGGSVTAPNSRSNPVALVHLVQGQELIPLEATKVSVAFTY